LKRNCLIKSAFPQTKTTRRNFGTLNLRIKQRLSFGKKWGKFTGKELDPETGLYYFGARYLDPKTSRWISGDPAMGEYVPGPGRGAGDLPGQGGVFNYVNLHVYHYAGNNPVRYVDPDGRFVPDSDGNLIAEKGDNTETLAKFQSITKREALNQLTEQGFGKKLKEGNKITLDNNYTRSIADAAGSPTTDQVLAQEAWDVNDYNCWGAAIQGTLGNPIRGDLKIGIDLPEIFDRMLGDLYTEVGAERAVFGGTILRFANSVETTHGAVFYGRSNDGTMYVYTKNGWDARPEVMRLSDLQSKIPEYGSVNGYFNVRR
jgi:RHS repeat-associated protein